MPEIVLATPVQALAEHVALPVGPVTVVIEDATGGGKTEAALVLAQRLITEGRADGLFVALPTMATADAMFARLAESYRRLFDSAALPSLALAHGRAGLNALFQGSILPTANSGGDIADGAGESASAQCAAWLAEERRRVFLAHVGVGTIDQALLGVLPARHASLRLFGLARKVLVVDEAHSYDPYVSVELDQLLAFHAMLGGSSIVLSATLPRSRRAALLGAVANRPVATESTEYPLVTVASASGATEHPAALRAVLRRDLPVRRVADMAAAVSCLVGAAEVGACGIWIRNTVDDARAGAEALRAAGMEPILFHARFAMGDRLAIQERVLRWFGKAGTAEDRAPGGRGRILVATQVVEQSLDLDADVMVSDLAPVDLLIQRAGRLRRHPERVRPSKIVGSEFLVVSPEPVAQPSSGWAADPAIGGSRFVYAPHVLWRSARALFAAGAIRVPCGVRALVEAVYGAEAEDVPPALAPAESQAEGRRIAEMTAASANLLDPRKGYCRQNGDWEPDTVMPTRLGDNYRNFRLAREEAGQLVPWRDDADPARAWALSEITLRGSLANDAVVPKHLEQALGRLCAGWPVWQRELPVLVLQKNVENWSADALRAKDRVRLAYSRELGLYPTGTS
jgi:CRISPR-associated endonuclease/helicase Cas3